MPKLVFVAENVCGAPSPFVLLGQEPKKRPLFSPDDNQGLVVEFTHEREAKHTVVTLRSDQDVEPGQTIAQEAEVPASEHYNIRTLSWTVPYEYRGRFHLRQLSWGDHNLLEQPGIV